MFTARTSITHPTGGGGPVVTGGGFLSSGKDGLDAASFDFSEAVNSDTLTTANITLTGPDGREMPFSLSVGNDQHAHVDFAPQTAPWGMYPDRRPGGHRRERARHGPERQRGRRGTGDVFTFFGTVTAGVSGPW